MAATKSKKKDTKKGAKKAPKKKPTARKKSAVPKGAAAKAGASAAGAGLAVSVTGTKKTNATLASVPVKAVVVESGFNPRSSLGSEADMKLLANNLKKDGLIHPIVVRPIAGKPGKFALVCGHRRLAAVKNLGWTSLNATIRADLEGDDARAKAIAVAENSEDTDKPLNHIEIGRVAQELQGKYKWKPERIAAETGVHAQTIRRVLKLMDAPKDVQAQVEAGALSMVAGVEIAKLDKRTRESIKDEITANTSAKKVRELAKKVASQSAAPKPGKAANKQKGSKRDAALVTWKGNKVKQAMIAELAHFTVNASPEEKKAKDYFEIRGALGYALWDRGDLELPDLPSEKKSEHDSPEDAKLLKKFNKLAKAEAKKYTPEDEEEYEYEEEA